MWVEDLPNGKYKYVERYEDALTGKMRKVSLTSTKHNRRTEKEMYGRLLDKIEEKGQQAAVNTTFQALTDKWLIVLKKQVKASTYETHKTTVNYLNQTLGDYQLDNLTPQGINQFLLDDLNKGNSYRYVSNKLSLIKRILRFGMQYGYFNDPLFIDKLMIPKINLSKKNKLKFLERDELQSAVEQLQAKGYNQEARFCQLQALTGMRYGELVALDYERQIDFKNMLINIDRTFSTKTRAFGSPKSGDERIININDKTVQLIREQIQFSRLMKLRRKLDRQEHLLFMSIYGNPYNIIQLNEKLHEIELPSKKHLTTHVFRHTFITYMVEAGVDSKSIAEHVGHSDTKMIEEVYSHFTEVMNARLKKAIDKVEII